MNLREERRDTMLAGIVCEYNPFHKGHLYHVEKTRQAGADMIVCVMSGNFVQRGECAFLDKRIRAEAAVCLGADVVLDLPVPWAVSSAENFARGSISLLKQFGVDVVSFGSECDDKQKLLFAAKSVDDKKVIALTKEYMSQGLSYPLSLSKSVSKLYGGEIADIISSPNSTLAVEYIRQILKYEGMDFLPVKRKGAAHDSNDTEGEYLCASKIRQDIFADERLFSALPEQSACLLRAESEKGFAPCLMKNNERGILSSLREMSITELQKYISDEKGLAGRIYEGVRTSVSLDELYEKVKSRNYTHSRVRREVLSAYLKIEKHLATETPPYIRILAVSEKGLSLLAAAKKNSALPIVTKHGEMQNLNEKSKQIYELQCSSTDKFALFSPVARECGLEQKSAMLIVK